MMHSQSGKLLLQTFYSTANQIYQTKQCVHPTTLDSRYPTGQPTATHWAQRDLYQRGEKGQFEGVCQKRTTSKEVLNIIIREEGIVNGHRSSEQQGSLLKNEDCIQ